MKCPNCQSANPEGARFCMNCGKPLGLTCPNCGTSLPAEAKFCTNCGHVMAGDSQPAKTQPAPANAATGPAPDSRLQQFLPKELLAKLEAAGGRNALEGERRVVTMLFCDVQGSTAAAGQLDPEEWAEIMNHAFERMIRPIYQYEGTVARLMGDGILAFFGAPIAHEDDPQRAILAGLQIVQAIGGYRKDIAKQYGIDFNVRVGINTGLVVVGAVGSDLRMEYTALGDAINLAARMEQTAQPGTVQVAEATYKLVAPLFDAEKLERMEVKGKSQPVQAYRILGPKAEPGKLRGIAGLDAPLIGRSEQMKALNSAVSQLGEGRGQVISVMGEAGLGKSRLLAELRRDTTGDPGLNIRWVEGRSLSYETSTPYAPFIDLLSECLDMKHPAPNEERYSLLKERLERAWPDCSAEAAPFLATLLGIPPKGEDIERVKYLEPPFLRAGVFHQVIAFFERLAASHPLVLVFDDVHWIDPTSLELLEALLPLTDQAPLAIVAAFRPRQQEPAWHFHETAGRDYPHRYTAIALEPLSEGQSRELVGSLLHIEDLPEKVRRLILVRAEGNPFFVEEMIRTLLDAGWVVQVDGHWRATREIENIALPDTLNGVITARLDRLDAPTRQVVEAAAVIGRDFDVDVLADLLERPELLESGLADLQRRELIREKAGQPQPAYLFKHVLTQEAAYTSILLSRRRDLHQRAAGVLERRQPEHAGDIARHYLEARQPAKAAPYLVAAGDRAARAYATQEAIDFYSKALDVRESIDDIDQVGRAYEGLGSALTFSNQLPQAVENYQTMLSLAESQGSIPMQVSALNKLAAVVGLRLSRFQEAEAYLGRADRLAHEQNVVPGIIEMSIVRCQMCTAKADFDKLGKHMGEVIRIGREMDSKEHLVMGLEHLSGSLMFLARFDEAWKLANEGLEVAREIGDREHEAWLLTQTLACCLVVRGELDAAEAVLHEGVQIAARIGALGPQIYGNWQLGEIARWRGQYEQAILYGQRALNAALPIEIYMPFMTVQPLGGLGTTYLEISGHINDQVAEFNKHALKLLETPGAVPGGGTAWVDLGFCAMTAGDLVGAEECFTKGLNLPTMFMYIERPRHLAGMAMIAMARGQFDEALKLISEARAYAEERGMHHILPLIAIYAGRIFTARGEYSQAIEHFSQAEEAAASMGMRSIVWQAHAGMAEALEASGRVKEAAAHLKSARAKIEEIAGLFQSEELQSSFRSQAIERIRIAPAPARKGKHVVR